MRSVLSSARPRYMVVYAAVLSGGLVFAAPAIASACAPVGRILVGWDNLDAASGPLGNCVNDEGNDGAGGRSNSFNSVGSTG